MFERIHVGWIRFEYTDVGIALLSVFVTCIVVYRHEVRNLFSRPLPVPSKTLPKRPTLQLLFQQPDDVSSSSNNGEVPSGGASVGSSNIGGWKTYLNSSLPDSFAPLLSSSQMSVLWSKLCIADLVHAASFKCSGILREGRHQIPLNKDLSRPQITFIIPEGGIRLNISVNIGSGGFSVEQDFDQSKDRMKLRTKTLIKSCNLSLDPPLPLDNVVPTLIHFPNLFEDIMFYSLFIQQRRPGFRWLIWLISLLVAFIEKLLWILETKCKVNLSQVKASPVYRGPNSVTRLPQWQLSLSFSGHLLLFNWIPVPFVSVVLPTYIIPAPYALVERLMSSQPLATAKLKHENILNESIAASVVEMIESWNVQTKMLFTPPALGVDVTLAGGSAVAVEAMLGRDIGVVAKRMEPVESSFARSYSGNSLSSLDYDPGDKISFTKNKSRSRNMDGNGVSSSKVAPNATIPYDANNMSPWMIEGSAHGKIEKERLSIYLTKLSITNQQRQTLSDDDTISHEGKSTVNLTGNLLIFKSESDPSVSMQNLSLNLSPGTGSPPRQPLRRRSVSASAATSDLPSVSKILFLQSSNNSTTSAQKRLLEQALQYDYTLDIDDSTHIDALSVSIGADNSLLQGGTMITTVFESIYANGSMSAREGSVLDVISRKRKRDILHHLPIVDITAGVENVYIPTQSMSFSDDGQTRYLPELNGGRLSFHIIGGTEGYNMKPDSMSNSLDEEIEGIKLFADFGANSLIINSDSKINEFPELDIFDGTLLHSFLSGTVGGRIQMHLRPQIMSGVKSNLTLPTGPNVTNPLEAYEIDFSRSMVILKIKESNVTLGHRRLIIPSETSFRLHVMESVVDMKMEGSTECECIWDFQGSSPMLQIARVGQSPADVSHENRKQVSMLIPPLRQGRLNFHVSSVGGIKFKEAATVRENKEGLYDWKFFNALVAVDDGAYVSRLFKVLHDKRSMAKISQVVQLINTELGKVFDYVLTQVWRAKEIFDDEGIHGPGHAIPSYKTARLLSLFLCGNLNEVQPIREVVQRVVAGEGLDIVKTKELLQKHIKLYDDWAPEFDRLVRLVAVMFSPMVAPAPYVENALPLCELDEHATRFLDVLPAKSIYNNLSEKTQLPLEPSFSKYLAKVSPYLSFRQVEYCLKARRARDWQPEDLRRLRYVYSIKKKVLEFSESYGGLSFLPQSFFVSIFVGEASKASNRSGKNALSVMNGRKYQEKLIPTLSTLRNRMGHAATIFDESEEDFFVSPAFRRATTATILGVSKDGFVNNGTYVNDEWSNMDTICDPYLLGESLLGPSDVAILLQAGLASAHKSSTVVQLNQRMLLDLIASQPDEFAIGVLAEIGTPGGHGSPRVLASALMALVELDQASFSPQHRIDMHALLESWLPGYKLPRRDDYLAGGRWARQSYYDAIYAVAQNILVDAEPYMALKGHLQKVRHNRENDPLPLPREVRYQELECSSDNSNTERDEILSSKLIESIELAKKAILCADEAGNEAMTFMLERRRWLKVTNSDVCSNAINLYRKAFEACSKVLELDDLAFQVDWFKSFWRRNYDALMIYSVYENVVNNVDNVRDWLDEMKGGSDKQKKKKEPIPIFGDVLSALAPSQIDEDEDSADGLELLPFFGIGAKDNIIREKLASGRSSTFFLYAERRGEQELVDAIIDVLFYFDDERNNLRNDPLVRLLIPNAPGSYDFTIISAMGIITDGRHGTELKAAFERIKERRGVETIRADTGTARSFEYNASKIEDAIQEAVQLNKPYGLLGYSQGCANILMAESSLLSGSPAQQELLATGNSKLVCRQLLFSAANGSMHGEASNTKAQKLIVMCEDALKYHQAYFSRAFISYTLEALNGMMDSAHAQKFFGGAHSMLPDGVKAFWREAQHLPNIPTCVLRGVLEEHTTPESLDMTCNLLTKQSGSALHDSQVHVYDAVGHPIYTKNRNGKILQACDMGGSVQRTHHWSPLEAEVEFIRTRRDEDLCVFDCAKDRHIFPWVDVNARFGIIKYTSSIRDEEQAINE